MKVQKRPRLNLEVLERREVPATIRFDGSNLLVCNPHVTAASSALTVTQGAGTAFQVKDGGKNNGTYTVTGNITIVGGNAHNTIAVNLSTTGLTGNLSIAAGNGASTVTVDNAAGAAPAFVAGNTLINLGKGGGSVTLGTAAGLTDNGNVTVINNGFLPANLVAGNAANASTFAGNFYAGKFSTVMLGVGAADDFRGNVTLNDNGYPQSVNYTLPANAVVRGDWTLIGGTTANEVNIQGNISGNLAATLTGSSLNRFILANGGTAVTIAGSVAFTGGNGPELFTLGGSAATILGNLALNWGNGANALGTTAGLKVKGNVSITNGNGGFNGGTSTAAGSYTANTFQAAVSGKATLNLGNGHNTFVFDGTNGALVGGTLSYTGGNGGNTVAVTNAPAGPAGPIALNASLGNSGANVFWLGGANGASPPAAGTVTGTVNFGPPSTAKPPGAHNTPFNPGDNYFMGSGYLTPGFITLTNPPT